jgi:hypothetical protein
LQPPSLWRRSSHCERHRHSSPQILGAVSFEVTSVTDSGEYLVYQYRIVNPISSRGGVAELEVDLSAPPGTGHQRLPFTGDLFPHGGADVDHVPFGGIAPDHWEMLVIKARLDWYADQVILTAGDVPVSVDSAPSGGVKDGFGLRSMYLPGLRRFKATPTVQSCCMQPNSRGEYPNAVAFPVAGVTVAPTVRPQDLTLEVLQSNLQQACGMQHWITAGSVCGSLRPKLEQAINAQKRGDHDSAKGLLRSFVEDLDAQHGPGKPVSDNAYWLLRVNGEYLFAHM